MDRKKVLAVTLIIFSFAGIIATLVVLKQHTDNFTHASPSDQLEAENGVRVGNANVQVDSNASGGSYIALGINASQTSTPTPTTGSQAGTIYNVPSSINSTGTVDVSAAMQNFVNSVPNGTSANPSIIKFPAGATYLLAGNGIMVDSRSNLIFEGNGATLKGTGYGILDSAFILGWGSANTNIIIRGFTLDGDNPDGATVNAYHQGQESSEGVTMYKGQNNIEIANNTISDWWGHAIYIASGGSSNGKPNQINVHDNNIIRMGLMGVAIATGTNITVKNNTITDTALYPIDIEDGLAGEPMQHIYILNNTINKWSWNTPFTGHAIIGDGATGMNWDDIVVDGNILQGGDQGPSSTDSTSGLISFWGSDVKKNLKVTNNISQVPADGWATRFNNVNGLTVTGNTLPGISGGATDEKVHVINSTNTVTAPNN